MSELRHTPHHFDLAGAAGYLELDADGVNALVAAGYLPRPTPEGFALGDLKAFVARNADAGTGTTFPTLDPPGDARFDPPGDEGPQELLDALDGRSDEMARRSFEIFCGVFPEAKTWPLARQANFVTQSRGRFEAILAVTGSGSVVDEALVGDLQDVGAAAAWSGSPLPQLLTVLRISRDLVVQTAVELAEERGRHWGLALSLLLTRVLPAMDRLVDALAQGYWAAIVGREEELRDRYQHVVETSSNGVFEVDLDGLIQYANSSLGVILGRRPAELMGLTLRDVIVPLDPAVSIEPLMTDVPGAYQQLAVRRVDGVRRILEFRTGARYRFDEVVGYQGVVRDVTAAHDLEADKNEFLALVTRDLRAPLATILAQGANLEAHAAELPADQVARVGAAIRGQAERIARLADDLYDVSRLESAQLALSVRSVDVAGVVHAALASVTARDQVEVKIPFGVEAMADPRRLEQIVANLVENGLSHGAPPVTVELQGAADGKVEIAIVDHGAGVAPALVEALFSGLRTLPNPDRDGSRGTGVGLTLVKGLVEAMGGSVVYEPAPEGGARFVVTLPQRA
ncbi:MAG: hypothetical protein NVS1B12_10720 [Acidimicrobiales bacterium]